MQSSVDELIEMTKIAKFASDLRKRSEEIVFNEAKDAIGLPMESKKYASSKCNRCYGKGGYVRVVEPVLSPDGQVYTKFHVVCECVHKGYSRTRIKIQNYMEKGVTFEEAAVRAGLKLP